MTTGIGNPGQSAGGPRHVTEQHVRSPEASALQMSLGQPESHPLGSGGPITFGIEEAALAAVGSLSTAFTNLATTGVYARILKRILDVVLTMMIIVVALPLGLLLALMVRVRLGPGVLYRQQRVGRDNRPFTMIKFRTMTPDRRTRVEAFTGPERRVCHKRDDDPRHTPFGRWLRRWSLDELPQLWNVLKGDMSLVGPRPELPQIVERYEPWQHQRHCVRPGLSGFWQISERAGGLAYEAVHIDIDYLRKMSFRTDVSVLLRTVPVAMRRTGR
jgi:lipopolysaccharide/colanic/teichoic acid biosynthesis glycosyltransferase